MKLKRLTGFIFSIALVVGIFSTMLGLFQAQAYEVRAYELGFDPGDVLQTKTQLGTKDPAYIVFTVVNTGLVFLGMITVVIIIAAGFMFLFAAGSEEKIKKAKDLLKGAIIGLVIVMSSYGVAQFVFTALQQAAIGTTAS